MRFLIGRARWQVQRHHGEIAKLRLDPTALGIANLKAQTCAHGIGLAAAINGGAGVAWFHGIEKVTVPAIGVKHGVIELMDLCLSFLNAQDIGATFFSEPVEKAFFRGRAYAIEVGGNDAHANVLQVNSAKVGHYAVHCRCFHTHL